MESISSSSKHRPSSGSMACWKDGKYRKAHSPFKENTREERPVWLSFWSA